MQRNLTRRIVGRRANDTAASQREFARSLERAETLAHAIAAKLDDAERELAEIRRLGTTGQPADAGQRRPAK
jgi:hypothetical protein